VTQPFAGAVNLVGRISYSKIFIMYFVLCVPLFFHAASSILEIRKRRRKVRRCFKCGHIGRMEPYLQFNKPFILAFVLLCIGLVPGLWYLRRVKKRYICGGCGKITCHIPVSDSLAH
jgi:hypothetical protein